MRIPDRYWWLQRAAGIALALVFPIALWFVSNSFTTFDWGSVGCMFLVLYAVFTFTDSFRAHDHYRRRLAALRGDLEVIPPADISVHADNAPNLGAEPFELMWHATRPWGRVRTILYAIIFVLLGGMWLAILLAIAFAVYLLATTKAIQPVTFDFPTVVMAAVIGVLLIGLLIEIPVAIVMIGRYWPRDHGRPFGMSTSSEGIMHIPGVGRRRLIRWEEMRLLEVKTTTGSYTGREKRSYRLYGRDAIAEWDDMPPSAVVMVGTPGMTSAEYAARHQALLDLIAARTGLTPRTFDTVRRAGRNR